MRASAPLHHPALITPRITSDAHVAHSLTDNSINAEAGIKLAEAFKKMPNLSSIK